MQSSGLLAHAVLLDLEDKDNFNLLLEMASAYWRMRRGWAAETELLNQATYRHIPVGDETIRTTVAGAFSDLATDPTLSLLHRYETRLSRIYHRAQKSLLLLRQSKPKQEVAVPAATDVQPPTKSGANSDAEISTPHPESHPPSSEKVADSKQQVPAKLVEILNYQTNLIPKSDTPEPVLNLVLPRR